MDVYGTNPKNVFGKIFRRNIWIWHPLWDFFENEYSEVVGIVKYGHSNDGDGLNNEDAIRLSNLISNDLLNDKIVLFLKNQHNNIEEEYRKKFKVNYDDFEDFKEFLLNCGGFTIC